MADDCAETAGVGVPPQSRDGRHSLTCELAITALIAVLSPASDTDDLEMDGLDR